MTANGARLVLVGITLAVLAPFLNKAFHIDDPLFLWMAQQIARHPADPYGFSVNWYSEPLPMSVIMQNPPLSSYYMALVGSLLGWSEPAMHAAFLLPAIASVLGTFALARRLCPAPPFAALLVLFTPGFLVSATNVMCDMVLLAFWVWSVEFWLAGLQRQQTSRLFIAAALISLAALTKYFGGSLVALLGLYTVACRRRLTLELAPLFLPIFVVATFEIITRMKYAHGLFSGAAFYSWTQSHVGKFLLTQFLSGLSFTGGCLISIFFLLRCRDWKSVAGGIFAVAASSLLFYFVLGRAYSIVVSVEGGIFLLTAIGIFGLAFRDLMRCKNADALLLVLWLLGTFAFSTFFNWSITARTFLPMAPAAAILLARRLASIDARNLWSANWPLLPGAIISLAVAAADYRLANTARDASRQFETHLASQPQQTWFDGHWGFQFYMQQWGAKPLDSSHSQVASDDIIIIPENATNVSLVSFDRSNPPDIVAFRQLPFITTFGFGSGAGFYSHRHGPLPWSLGLVRPEIYQIGRVD